MTDAMCGQPAPAPKSFFMTSLGHERDFGGAAESGVLASLSKPIHRDQLLACLRLAIALPPLVAEQEPGEALSAPLLPGDDIEAGRVLLAEDNLINQKVVVAMLSSAGYRVDTVLNGAEGGLAVA